MAVCFFTREWRNIGEDWVVGLLLRLTVTPFAVSFA